MAFEQKRIYNISEYNDDINQGVLKNISSDFNGYKYDAINIDVPGLYKIDKHACELISGSTETVMIGDDVRIIGERGLAFSSSVKHIEFGPDSSLERIQTQGLRGNTKLEDVALPNSCHILESGAFGECTNLKHVDLNQVGFIGDSTFAGCRSLERITIPESTIFVGGYAFSQCDSLKEITVVGQDHKYFEKDALINLPKNVVVAVECESLRNELQSKYPNLHIVPLDYDKSRSLDEHNLTDLVKNNQAFVLNEKVIFVAPEVSGTIVVNDPTVRGFESGSLAHTNVHTVSGPEHLEESVKAAGKEFKSEQKDLDNIRQAEIEAKHHADDGFGM